MSVYDTVVEVRAKYGSWEETLADGTPNPAFHRPTPEELGAILNEVAWRHRADGWGVNAKPNGFNVPQPLTGIAIASDILHHQPTNKIYDVLISAGERAEPAWQEQGVMNDPTRPWVAPMPVGDVDPPPVPPPTETCKFTPCDVTVILDALADIHERLVAIESRCGTSQPPWELSATLDLWGAKRRITGTVGEPQ